MLSILLALASPIVEPQVPARRGYLTAGELDRRCSSAASADASYCYAYIAAVHDSVRSYELWLNMQEFCAPATTAQADLRSTFIDHMRSHPEDKGGQAASVVVVSFKQRFPCVAPAIKP